MNFVPAVRDHVPSVHVGGDGGLFSRPIHPRPFVPPLLWRQISCIDEIVLRVSVPRCLSFELFKIRVAHGVAQPSALTKPRGKQQAAALLVGLSSPSPQVVLAGGILVRVGNEQVVQCGVGGESVARCGFDGRLQARQFIDDGLSCEHGLNVLFEGGHGGVHVEAVASLRIIGSGVRIDAHDWGGGIDVVRQRGQGAVPTKHDHQISGDKVGTTDVLPRLVIHLVVIAGRVVEDGFECHQALIVNLFEVFFEDDQDVQSSPLVTMQVAHVQEHHPPFKDEKLSRSTLPSKVMEGTSPWGDSPEEQPKGGAGTSPAPQPVSISDGFAPMNQGTILTGTTEAAPGQLIYLQPPSNAAKVLGILMVIYGVVISLITIISLLTVNMFSIEQLADIYGISDADIGKLVIFLNTSLAFTLFSSVAFVLAGIWVKNYQRRGIILALVLTLVSLLFDTAIVFIFPEFIGSGFVAPGREGVIVESVFTSILCGLIWAIPLMVANNGLDDSKLF